MSDLALFELEQEWHPVFHPRGPWQDRGERATDATKDEWAAWSHSLRCRDCGRLLSKCTRTHSCGGGALGDTYDLCDDCAALDGCEARGARHRDEMKPNEHISWWGIRTTDAEHARLSEQQRQRRAKYLSEVAS